MPNMHVSRHTIAVVERVAEIGFVTAAAVLAAISGAILIYTLFIS